jgi:hypothetical protein
MSNIAFLGLGNPITPFTKPASRKVSVATTRGSGSTEGIGSGTVRRDWLYREVATSPSVSEAVCLPSPAQQLRRQD